ncbi:MAG: helix-turn-helix transcriptional regulator [Thermoguttaceae bacterium]|jgi:hypothetical protein
MIATPIVEEIRGLLAEGRLSQRKIAQRLGISRGTVNAIAQGKRADRPSDQDWHGGFPYPAGVPQRCPGCGGLVQMPCLLCHIRALKGKRR